MKEKQIDKILDDIRINVLNGKKNEEIMNIIQCIYERDREKLAELIKAFSISNGQSKEEEILTMLTIACTYQKDKKYIMIAGILADIKNGKYKFDYVTILRLFFDSLDNYNIKLAEQFFKMLRIKAIADSSSDETPDEVINKEVGYTLAELEQMQEQTKKRKEELPKAWESKLQSILMQFETSEENESMVYLDERLTPAEREILKTAISIGFQGRLKRYNVGHEPKRQVIRYMNAAKVNRRLSRDYVGLYEQGEYSECIEVIKNYLIDPKEACIHPAMYAYLALAYYNIGDIAKAKFYMEIAEAFNENKKENKKEECEDTKRMMNDLHKWLKQDNELVRTYPN